MSTTTHTTRTQRLADYEARGRNTLPDWAKEIIRTRHLTEQEWLAVRHSLIDWPTERVPVEDKECPF